MVEELVSKTLEKGEHEIRWDGSSYSSGVYFYKLVAKPVNGGNTYISTKKMILAK